MPDISAQPSKMEMWSNTITAIQLAQSTLRGFFTSELEKCAQQLREMPDLHSELTDLVKFGERVNQNFNPFYYLMREASWSDALGDMMQAKRLIERANKVMGHTAATALADDLIALSIDLVSKFHRLYSKAGAGGNLEGKEQEELSEAITRVLEDIVAFDPDGRNSQLAFIISNRLGKPLRTPAGVAARSANPEAIAQL